MKGIRNRKTSTGPRTWSYARAFLLTLGLAFVAVAVFAFSAQGRESGEWPVFAWILLAVLCVAGFGFCWISMRGADQSVKRWIGASDRHEGAILIAILAAPVYWIGTCFGKPRRRR